MASSGSRSRGLARAVPASLYRELVEPTAGLPVRGVVWYQGESNAVPDAPEGEYRLWLKSLVASWQDLWHSPDLPFIVMPPSRPWVARRDIS